MSKSSQAWQKKIFFTDKLKFKTQGSSREVRGCGHTHTPTLKLGQNHSNTGIMWVTRVCSLCHLMCMLSVKEKGDTTNTKTFRYSAADIIVCNVKKTHLLYSHRILTWSCGFRLLDAAVFLFTNMYHRCIIVAVFTWTSALLCWNHIIFCLQVPQFSNNKTTCWLCVFICASAGFCARSISCPTVSVSSAHAELLILITVSECGWK